VLGCSAEDIYFAKASNGGPIAATNKEEPKVVFIFAATGLHLKTFSLTSLCDLAHMSFNSQEDLVLLDTQGLLLVWDWFSDKVLFQQQLDGFSDPATRVDKCQFQAWSTQTEAGRILQTPCDVLVIKNCAHQFLMLWNVSSNSTGLFETDTSDSLNAGDRKRAIQIRSGNLSEKVKHKIEFVFTLQPRPTVVATDPEEGIWVLSALEALHLTCLQHPFGWVQSLAFNSTQSMLALYSDAA
jgi:hypothetical protein